ncbi:hypothetical protein ACFL6M_06890 [Candidatus Eisenbacteria bacterium]|uniref:Uncharacterized protein n=1 Tax=Eiseniibacteriota bacterium TaxID=2212470 RepID=A0ABV6YMA1_UNCEI
MKRYLVYALLPCALVLGVSSCGQDVSIPDSADPVLMNDPPEGTSDPPDMEQLITLWLASMHDQWDEISGTIHHSEGGSILGVPETWPLDDSYLFWIEVPPGALPGDTDSTTITIRIPKYQENPAPGTERPAVFILEPDGLQFLRPVTVVICYPPWLDAAEYYSKFCMFLVQEDPIVVGFSDLGRVTSMADNHRFAIPFETMHFSRWALENGKGGGPLCRDKNGEHYYDRSGWEPGMQ